MDVEEFFEKEGIDIGDIVCYTTPEGTKPPKDFCPMEMAEKYHEHKLKLLNLHIVSNNNSDVCVDWDDFRNCERWNSSRHGCGGCPLNPHK